MWFTAPVRTAEPQQPAVSPSPRFPWIPAVTPVVLAVLMSLLVQSSLALIMGVVGPAMVAGAWWESQRSHHRSDRASWQEYEEQLSLWRHSQELSRENMKREALAAQPGLLKHLRDPLWRDRPGAITTLRIGTGWWTPPPGDFPEASEAVSGMPALVEGGRGIALVGPDTLMPIWRSLLAVWISASRQEQREFLPEGLGEGAPAPRDYRGLSRAAWVSRIEDVPGECEILVVASGAHHVHLRDSTGVTRTISPDRLSGAEFAWVARRLGLPLAQEAGSLEHDYTRRDELFLELGDRSRWDLVQQGPHGVVWGSTGSGKSVTVASMVCSLATRYSPEKFVCVVIDFKGGAGLATLTTLPHTVGCVTDLDPSRAQRALAGITREMEARERLLLENEVSDIAMLPEAVPCPRLIIALDEAAWLLGNFPAWASVLADVLARGRSLGIHVLIATQRVHGVLSPAMMANISLRVCGRVSDEGEITAWMSGLSTRRIEALRGAPPGSAVAVGAHRLATNVTLAPPDISGMPGFQPSSWRVWTEELPQEHPLAPGSWGLLDDTLHRCHKAVTFDPWSEGSVLVVGDPRSGRTTALAALAAQCSEVVVAPQDPLSVLLLIQAASQESILVIDDVDDLLARSGSEGAPYLLEHLAARRGVVLMSTKASTPSLRGLSRIASHTLILSLANPESSMAVGGAGKQAPGRGTWDGREVQVACGGELGVPSHNRANSTSNCPPIVISRFPEEWRGVETSFLGRPTDLFAAWASLLKSVDKHPVIIDRVAPLELRQATAGYLVVPPIAPPEGAALLWERGKLCVVMRERWQR